MKKLLILIPLLSLLILSCQNSKPKKGFVILSPEIAEIFVQISGDKQIIGVTEECNYPEVLKSKTKVGNFGQVKLETIIKLNPEYVICSALEQKAIAEELKKLGIKVIVFYPKKIDDLLNTIVELGKITHSEANAQKLQNDIKHKLETYKSFKTAKKQKVLIEIYNDPIMSASDSSYVGELLSYAGGENAFPVLERDYCRVKNEDVIKANPDVIIITYPGMNKEAVIARKGWQNITAVKNKRIYTIQDINPDLLLRATPRSIDAIQLLRDLIYE